MFPIKTYCLRSPFSSRASTNGGSLKLPWSTDGWCCGECSTPVDPGDGGSASKVPARLSACSPSAPEPAVLALEIDTEPYQKSARSARLVDRRPTVIRRRLPGPVLLAGSGPASKCSWCWLSRLEMEAGESVSLSVVSISFE